MLPKIAEAMGIDSSTEETLWRDHALAAVNFAVLYSFKLPSAASIVDHHTAAASFAQWHAEELKKSWILPRQLEVDHSTHGVVDELHLFGFEQND